MAATNPGDLFKRLMAAQESLSKVQETIARFALPVEQQKALVDNLRKLMLPREQLQAMQDLIESFGPPVTQVKNLQDDIDTHREMVAEMSERLDRMSASADRLAAATETLNEFYGAWTQAAGVFGWNPLQASGEPVTDAADTPDPDELDNT
ncbi:MAG: hypothetical protein GY708_19985 [Actinomycetia bacterium]|nr:hypothetical protein [Actinomycetes bacterium]MCP4962043.1 hypothetical protein [Actinomycetes bacterium]